MEMANERTATTMKDDRLISFKEVLAEIDAMPPVKAEGHEFIEKTCLKTRLELLPSVQTEERTDERTETHTCDL